DVERSAPFATSLSLVRPFRRGGNPALPPGGATRHRGPSGTSTCFPFQAPPLRTAWRVGTTLGQSAASRVLLEKFLPSWRGLESVGGLWLYRRAFECPLSRRWKVVALHGLAGLKRGWGNTASKHQIARDDNRTPNPPHCAVWSKAHPCQSG